jgi:nicotinamidase-related amidase
MNMDYYVTPETLDSQCKKWIAHIDPFNTHQMQLNPAHSALLVVDMQLFFLDPDSPSFTCGGLAILPKLIKLVQTYRASGLPVIYTRHVHHPGLLDAGLMAGWWEGMCLEGSPKSKVHGQIAPQGQEKEILKHRYSAFYNTDLETILRCMKVEDLVVTGIMTNMCCESTARDAYYRDYRVFFLADATGSITEEMHLASLLNLAFGFAWVTTTESILQQLGIRDASNARIS